MVNPVGVMSRIDLTIPTPTKILTQHTRDAKKTSVFSTK